MNSECSSELSFEVFLRDILGLADVSDFSKFTSVVIFLSKFSSKLTVENFVSAIVMFLMRKQVSHKSVL